MAVCSEDVSGGLQRLRVRLPERRLRVPPPAALKCTVTFVTASLATSILNLHPAMEVCSGDVSGGPPNTRMGRCVPGTFPEMAVNMWHESMISILIYCMYTINQVGDSRSK